MQLYCTPELTQEKRFIVRHGSGSGLCSCLGLSSVQYEFTITFMVSFEFSRNYTKLAILSFLYCFAVKGNLI